jgi:hypothetical protein
VAKQQSTGHTQNEERNKPQAAGFEPRAPHVLGESEVLGDRETHAIIQLDSTDAKSPRAPLTRKTARGAHIAPSESGDRQSSRDPIPLLIEQEIIEGEKVVPSLYLFEEFRCTLCPEILTQIFNFTLDARRNLPF